MANARALFDPCDFASRAWKEIIKVCGDLVSEGCRNPKPDWSMELRGVFLI
jgi:hypothetical protein